MSFLKWLESLLGGGEKPSPSDIVPEGNIRYDEAAQLVLISLGSINIPFTKPPKVWFPGLPNTNSMIPVFDFGHNNILIQGADEANQRIMVDFLKVGDIIGAQVFPGRYDLGYFIHRIKAIGKDSEGRFFRTKGDNNAMSDPWKVRDSAVKWLYIGTIA